MREEWKAALAATAAAAGTGLVSGEAAASFFAPLGARSWTAILIASIVFGLLCGLTCRWVKQNGGQSMIGAYLICFGDRKGRALSVLHLIPLLLLSLKLLAEAGHMAMLLLPIRYAFWIGAAAAAGAALLLNRRGMWRVGGIALCVTAVYCVALAVDPRNPLENALYETEPRWNGSWIAVFLLPSMYVALCLAAAAPVTAKYASYIEGIGRFAFLCGCCFCAVLLTANAALCRGGARLLAQRMPFVVLAARWGGLGFYVTALLRTAGATLTLTATAGMLTRTVLNLK